MKEGPSPFDSSGAARDENRLEHFSGAWNGDPRVIYDDVENRLESLKRARRLAHTGGGGAGSGTGSAASATGKENEEIASRVHDRFGPLDDDEIADGAKRFVDVVLDPPGEMYAYFQGKSQVPRVDVMVVDRRGQERRAMYGGGEMERVEVDSVIVVRDPTEVPIAAYLVGQERYQVFLVGSGVACAPTLLTQKMYEAIGGIRGSRKYWFTLNRNPSAGASESSGAHDYADIPADDDSIAYEDEDDDDDEFGDVGYVDEPDFATNAQQEGWDYGDDAHVGAAYERRAGMFGEAEEAEAARKAEQALVLREEALRAIAGKGRSVRGEARRGYDLFRRAADMGDADSYFYLSLLQSAGLGEGGSEVGRARSRTWAMCGVSGFRTDAALLLGFRYHAGRGERQMCSEGARFYQMAIDELRLDRADEVQPDPNAADVYRLGGEYGLGGWGVNLGGIGGGIDVLDGGVSSRTVEPGVADGAGEVHDMPMNAEPRDDLFLRAEIGEPVALMALGYIAMMGSDDLGMSKDSSRAERLMWQAVRAGEARAYAYLGWMHHHGHIGGHAQPDEQVQVPPHEDWHGPFPESEMLSDVALRWGDWVVLKAFRDKAERDNGGGARRDRNLEGEMYLGEDIWGGLGSEDVVFDWVLQDGGVSGANKAAALYREGFEAGDPACAAALGDMYLHSEYSDSRDGRGAGGKWSMIQAERWYHEARHLGERYLDPHPVAAYRLGSMLQLGLVPYVGVNMTEAFSMYEKAESEGSMDAMLAMGDLHFYGLQGVAERSCEEGCERYKRYADFCIMEDALADGRVAFEQGRYREAFLYYLIAAEQGSKEGQTSLSWLLSQGVAASSSWSLSSYLPFASYSNGFGARVLSRLGLSSDVGERGMIFRGMGGGGDGPWGDGLSDVVEAVREMGGDPEAMARQYRMLAASQGDGDARCEIADELLDQARARGAVSTWAGWFWPGTSSGGQRRGSGVVRRDHQHQDSLGASPLDGAEGDPGDQALDDTEEAEAAEVKRLLEEAIEFYTLATTSSDDTGARRALFSLGWLHQYGLGVPRDHALARGYYLKSASAPATLGLVLMGLSDFCQDALGPIVISAVAVGFSMLWIRWRGRIGSMGLWRATRVAREELRRRRRRRPLAAATATSEAEVHIPEVMQHDWSSAMAAQRHGSSTSMDAAGSDDANDTAALTFSSGASLGHGVGREQGGIDPGQGSSSRLPPHEGSLRMPPGEDPRLRTEGAMEGEGVVRRGDGEARVNGDR